MVDIFVRWSQYQMYYLWSNDNVFLYPVIQKATGHHFAETQCACVTVAVLCLFIPSGAETSWPLCCRKHLVRFCFLYDYYCILIRLILRLKQNCDPFVFWSIYIEAERKLVIILHMLFSILFHVEKLLYFIYIYIRIEAETKWPSFCILTSCHWSDMSVPNALRPRQNGPLFSSYMFKTQNLFLMNPLEQELSTYLMNIILCPAMLFRRHKICI